MKEALLLFKYIHVKRMLWETGIPLKQYCNKCNHQTLHSHCLMCAANLWQERVIAQERYKQYCCLLKNTFHLTLSSVQKKWRLTINPMKRPKPSLNVSRTSFVCIEAWYIFFLCHRAPLLSKKILKMHVALGRDEVDHYFNK